MDENIASRYVVIMKWLLPPVALFFIGIPVVELVAMGQYEIAGFLVFSAIVFLVCYKFLVFDLADEVYDEVTQLRIRRRKVWECIPYQDIEEVEFDSTPRTSNVVIRLKRPGAFGKQIVFVPTEVHYAEHVVLRAKAAQEKR